MHKKSKLSILMLSALLALTVPMAACSGGSEESSGSSSSSSQSESYVKLVDFENATETVGLGEYYTLPSGVVFDEDGYDYKVTYEVKDANGEKVTPTNSRFKVTKLGEAKYIITCYAKIEADKYMTRTITLNVVDRAAPEIICNEVPYALVGEEYTIQGVEIVDNTGETIVPTYQLFDASGTEVTITNGKFTPAEKGVYTLKVTATDSANNVGTGETPIYVLAKNEVNGFSSEEQMTNTIALADFTAEWLANYEGKDGVVKLTSSASWAYFAFMQLQDMSAYEGYEYVVVRMLVPETTEVSDSFYLGEAEGQTFGATRGEWVEYAFSGDTFRTIWSKEDFHAWNKMINMRVGGEIYIDEVFMMNDVSDLNLNAVVTNVTSAGEDLMDGDVFSIALPSNAPANAEISVVDPNGNEVTDLTQITAKFGNYTVVITCDGYLGEVTQTINVKGTFNFELVGENSVRGKEVTLKSYKATKGDQDVTQSAEVQINVTMDGYTGTIAVSNGKFTAPFTGAEYKVEYVVTLEGKTYKYYDAVTVASVYQVANNEVISFAEPVQMAKVHTYDSSVEWVAEYQGKTGVAKFTAKNWGYFGFETMQEMSKYEDATTLVIRMYIETADYYGSLWFGGALVHEAGAVEAGKWVEYRFPIETFKNNWAKTAADDYVWTADDIWSMALSVGSEGVFYIDEVYTLTEEVVQDVVPQGAVSVLAVNNASDVNSIGGGNKQEVVSVEYLNSFEGAKGVAKITTSGYWVRFGVEPTEPTGEYADYQYVVVRMYIEADTAPQLFFDPTGSPDDYVYTTTTVETGKWVDYYFDGATFYALMEKGWNNYYSTFCTMGGGTFYIDQVYMTNEAP